MAIHLIHTMKKLYVLSLMLGLLLGGAGPAFGQTAQASSIFDTIYISEVNWAGSSLSLADEWLEITNGSSQTMDLSGWIVDGAAASGGALQIAAGTTIASQQTILIANYNVGDAKTTLTVTPALVTSAVSLANSNLTLRLIDPSGVVHDTLAFGSSPSAGSSSPFTSAVRTGAESVVSATASRNLLDTNQLGTPGDVDVVALDITEVTENPAPEVQNESEDSIATPIPEEIQQEEDTESTDSIDPCCGCTCVEESNSTLVEEEPLFTSAPITSEPIAQEQNEPEEVVEETLDEIVEEILGNPEDLILSEFVSDPADGVEWIELFNPSVHRVDIAGMYITDSVGGKTTLAGLLESRAYSVIENPKGKLNNDADSVLLYTKEGTLIAEVHYGTTALEAAEKGESIGLVAQEWQVLASPTKGDANQPNPAPIAQENDATDDEGGAKEVGTEVEEVEEANESTSLLTSEEKVTDEDPSVVTIVSIAEKPGSEVEKKSTSTKKSGSSSSSKSSANTETSITGILTVAPGILGKQIAYLEGYQLYFNKAEWPQLNAGDSLRVQGVLSTLNNERRLKIASAEAISLIDQVGITPHTLGPNRITSEYVGYTFNFDVAIGEREKRDLTTTLSGTEIRIRLPKDVNGNLLPEDTLRGKGILRSNKDGFYIEVLTKGDLILAETQQETQAQGRLNEHHKSSRSKSMAGAGLFTGTLGALGYWLRKALILS